MLKITFIGHLGNPAVVNTVNGKTVINFSAASTEKWKDQSGVEQSKTQWVEFSHWTDKTGVAPYLQKGTQVYVEGVGEVKTFQKTDGTTGASLAVRVLSIQLLGSPQGQQQQQQPAQPQYPQPGAGGFQQQPQFQQPPAGQQFQQPGQQQFQQQPGQQSTGQVPLGPGGKPMVWNGQMWVADNLPF